MSEIELVQIRMKAITFEQLENIQISTNAASRSDAIRKSVDLVDTLLKAVKNGSKIILEDKKGKCKELILSGF
jgi:hypothetical protein